ncbi:S8 family serine peptidase [Jatrophihabitans fulvus]
MAAVAAAGLTAALTTVTAPAGAAPAATPARYAVSKPVCAKPKDPRAMRCFAMRQVPAARTTTGAYPVPHVGRGPVGGFTPRQLAAAYGYNPQTPRPRTTVAIVLWHDAPTVLSDLNRFNARYGLKKETAYTFRKVNERGRPSPLPRRDADAGVEVALDTQAVRGACNTCRILLVEADGPYDTDLANAVNTAVRLGATIVTNSYGTTERRFDTAVQRAYKHPGVAILASTGDSGWFGWDGMNEGYVGEGAASFPATSPYVIAVGGTTLKLTSANKRASETVWNSNGPHNANGYDRERALGASGGGCSKYFNAQPWQRMTPNYAKSFCNGRRLAADMSMVANPATGYDIYDSSAGGWITIGGTSLSAPLAAGVLALAGGAHGARYPSSALYANAATLPGRRYDVTVGGNGYCNGDSPAACATGTEGQWGYASNPNALGAGPLDCSFVRSESRPYAVPSTRRLECSAAKGYDGPTGVGTPTSTRLFWRTDPYLGVRFATPTHGRYATFSAFLRAPLPRTTIRSTTWSWGDGRTLRTTSASAKHNYRRAGRYTLTLSSYDSRYQTVIIKRTITVR